MSENVMLFALSAQLQDQIKRVADKLKTTIIPFNTSEYLMG